MSKMNAEIKAQWVAALRSGEIPQTTGELRDSLRGVGRCCLGVLCDLAERENVGQWLYGWNDRSGYFFASEDEISSDAAEPAVVPASVKMWADLPLSNPYIQVGGDKHSLAELNDGGLTFPQIADVIDYFL